VLPQCHGPANGNNGSGLVGDQGIHAEAKERYGSLRIHQELKKRGFTTIQNNVAKSCGRTVSGRSFPENSNVPPTRIIM
jgi:hypothetical protein